MSGMLHPVGPEPARTYWIRRSILLAVVLVLALGVVLAISSLSKAAVATAPPPVIAPAPETASPSTPAPSASTAASPVGPSAPPSTGPSAGASTNPSTNPSTNASTTVNPSAQPSGSATAARPSTSAHPTGSAVPSTAPRAEPTATAPVGTPDCRPSDLRVTLKGDRTLKPGQNDEFTLSLINGGAATCLASVTDTNFELKIYSGQDRIWSSKDCAKVLTDFDKRLATQADVAWTMTWNGERSVRGKSCKTGSDTPRAGTYWATAQLKGADPVQLRMIIR